VRKYAGKITLIAAAVALALYFLWPTYRDWSLHSRLQGLVGQDSAAFVEANEEAIRGARAKRLKLGLDLQGGMRVVLEVNVLKLLDDLAKNKDETYAQITAAVREEAIRSEESSVTLLRREFEKRGIRMSRYYRSLRDTNDDITAFLEDESTKAIDRAMEIVRNRVDQYGVSEPSIQKLGGSRIIVELPGVSREAEVRSLLQGTALLEFKLLKDPEIAFRVMENIDKALAAATGADTARTDTAASDTTRLDTPEGEMSREEFARKHPFFTLALLDQRSPGEAFVAEENRDEVRRILNREEVRRLIPADLQFLWSAKPVRFQDGTNYYVLYPVKGSPELTGGVITTARATTDPGTNQYVVTMAMDDQGSRDWSRITGANINKRIAIVLDNAVFSAPVVRSKISGGNSQIEGMESIEEARLLEIVLKAGALPAPVEIAEQRSVGPSLGEDSIRNGILAGLAALAITALFMVVYYSRAGTIAVAALIFCVLFLIAVLAAFQGTLTLPGIAGIILTLAVAVDANVLIYERIREEVESGKTLRASIDAGYAKAWSAILDSNITTFITGVILYQFGTGPVQGFALTLMIGIVASMFSAIFITRVVFDVISEKSGAQISFG
jgi:SecD/SecF fusion protein